jgi:hypothetical protein
MPAHFEKTICFLYSKKNAFLLLFSFNKWNADDADNADNHRLKKINLRKSVESASSAFYS